MSRSRHSDGWRWWGEERKQRSLMKDFQDWKKQAREEMEDMNTEPGTVYVIINEWLPSGSGAEAELREIVDGRYFLTEDEAWYALEVIASSESIHLEPTATSVEVPPGGGIEYETYYIQELMHG